MMDGSTRLAVLATAVLHVTLFFILSLLAAIAFKEGALISAGIAVVISGLLLFTFASCIAVLLNDEGRR